MLRGIDLAQAVSRFASRAAERLRAQQAAAGAVLVFIATSPFRRDDAQYSRSVSMPLLRPTADTGALVGAAVAGLRRIYRKGYRYAKAGVMLLELQPRSHAADDCDGSGQPTPRARSARCCWRRAARRCRAALADEGRAAHAALYDALG